jgi:uncharacterized membrane protein
MNFPDQLLPFSLIWACNGLALILLGWVGWTAPWKRIAGNDLQNVWMGTSVLVMMLWSIKTGVKPGLNFHLLGATAMTLMFGARLAMAGMAVVLVAITMAGGSGWSVLGLNWLLTGVLPVGLSYLLYSVVDRKLPNHLFIYIFINAFIGAGVVIVLTGAVTTAVLILSQVYSAHYLTQNYLPYYILMGWSEAMLTGMSVTLMTVFRPLWLATFSDARYLKDKSHQND